VKFSASSTPPLGKERKMYEFASKRTKKKLFWEAKQIFGRRSLRNLAGLGMRACKFSPLMFNLVGSGLLLVVVTTRYDFFLSSFVLRVSI